MNPGAAVEVGARKVGQPGLLAGLVMLLAAHLPSAGLAQEGIDRVTGFPREPVQPRGPAAERSR